jgi:hypothetical protein
MPTRPSAVTGPALNNSVGRPSSVPINRDYGGWKATDEPSFLIYGKASLWHTPQITAGDTICMVSKSLELPPGFGLRQPSAAFALKSVFIRG